MDGDLMVARISNILDCSQINYQEEKYIFKFSDLHHDEDSQLFDHVIVVTLKKGLFDI